MPTVAEQTFTKKSNQSMKEALEAAFSNQVVITCSANHFWIGNTADPTSTDGDYYFVEETSEPGVYSLRAE